VRILNVLKAITRQLL